MTALLRAGFLLLWALLSSCVTKPPAPVTIPPPAEAGYPADLQGARLYRIDSAQSRLHILVYRAGTLAQLGHNHVLSSNSFSGFVWLHDALARSGFSIAVPVNELLVDDPQARAVEGSDFAANVTDAARAGTRANMLKPEQLDGERYPLIRVRSLNVGGTRERPMVHAAITIKDRTRELDVPVHMTLTDALRVTGEFMVRQTEFGIQPYSAALGAVQVQDQVTIRFDLAAVLVN